LLAQVGLRVPVGPTHLLAQQLGKQGFFYKKTDEPAVGRLGLFFRFYFIF
jgi:hypothetical protein